MLIKLVGPGAHGARIRARVHGREITRVAATNGGRAQSDPRVHLGLGWTDAADSVAVIWPGGEEEALGSLPGGAEVTVRRGAGVVDRRWLSSDMR